MPFLPSGSGHAYDFLIPLSESVWVCCQFLPALLGCSDASISETSLVWDGRGAGSGIRLGIGPGACLGSPWSLVPLQGEWMVSKSSRNIARTKELKVVYSDGAIFLILLVSALAGCNISGLVTKPRQWCLKPAVCHTSLSSQVLLFPFPLPQHYLLLR